MKNLKAQWRILFPSSKFNPYPWMLEKIRIRVNLLKNFSKNRKIRKFCWDFEFQNICWRKLGESAFHNQSKHHNLYYINKIILYKHFVILYIIYFWLSLSFLWFNKVISISFFHNGPCDSRKWAIFCFRTNQLKRKWTIRKWTWQAMQQ